MSALMLFSLVFGQIAQAVKTGQPTLGTLKRITLGWETETTAKCSACIQDSDGQWFRLTVEAIDRPVKWPA